MRDSYAPITDALALIRQGRGAEGMDRLRAIVASDAYDKSLRIEAGRTLSELLLRHGRTDEAADCLEEVLALYAPSTPEAHADKAALHNTAGSLRVESDPTAAVRHHRAALELFETTSAAHPSDELTEAIANTHLALAEAHFKKKDYYHAKKHYRSALQQLFALGRPGTASRKANAHFHLGYIAIEENNTSEAQRQLLKALDLYKALASEDLEAFGPFLGATYTNLGVAARLEDRLGAAIQYYEEAAAVYQQLAHRHPSLFRPYYAATLNTLGGLYTQRKDLRDDDPLEPVTLVGLGILSRRDPSADADASRQRRRQYHEKALEYYLQALDQYQQLADEAPDIYTAHIAALLHNIATAYDEYQQPDKALEYYERALHLRRRLAERAPEFIVDVAATILNMVTLYQSLLEQRRDIAYKAPAIRLLAEARQYLARADARLPAVDTMRSEAAYFEDYFRRVDAQYIDRLDIRHRLRQLHEAVETAETPEERFRRQEAVVDLLRSACHRHPDDERFQSDLVHALTNAAWYALLAGRPDEGLRRADEGLRQAPAEPALRMNRAHALLLLGRESEARAAYQELITANPSHYHPLIRKDLWTLTSRGLLPHIPPWLDALHPRPHT